MAAAAPVDPETSKDLRCFLAMSATAQSEDKAASLAATIGGQYFLGRVDGRSPDLDLESAIVAEASSMTDASLKSLLQSCGQLMQERGRAVQGIGERMQKKERHSSSTSS
ncbi:MAG TPA: hypothetical protein VK485_01630 [Sphingomicrobium sp.]|nr:hypothetical protein [Sphingomicrobium sp.]